MKISVAPIHHSAALTSKDRRMQIHADIQRYGSACGCELGSVFMVGAIIVFLIYITFGANGWSAGESVLRGIVWVTSLTAVGKLLGLTSARVRLHILRAALRREFPTSPDQNASATDV